MADENPADGQKQPVEPGKGDQTSPEGAGTPDSAQKKPTLAEIAADWGTSVPYVSKFLPKEYRGSLEMARKFRAEHGGRGSGYRSKKKSPAAEATGDDGDTPLPPKTNLSRIDASRKAAVDIEENAKQLVDQAILNKDSEALVHRIRAFTQAQTGRYESERQVREILERDRTLIPFDEAKTMTMKVMNALFTRLRAVPRKAAALANPADDVLAEEVIRKAIEEAISEVHADESLFV